MHVPIEAARRARDDARAPFLSLKELFPRPFDVPFR